MVRGKEQNAEFLKNWDEDMEFLYQEPSEGGPTIVAIGGGKGGVGKSFLVTNIAARVAIQGFRVGLFDLDLGTANSHSHLGLPLPTYCVLDFLEKKQGKLSDYGHETYIPNLTFWGFISSLNQTAFLSNEGKSRLLKGIQALDLDFVFLDLGAGIYIHTLDFFMNAHLGILVMTPEPTSIENTYSFIKAVFARKIQTIGPSLGVPKKVCGDILKQLNDLQDMTPIQKLEEYIEKHDEVNKKLLDKIKETQIVTLVNEVRVNDDKELGVSMAAVSNTYFGFATQAIGYMKYDDNVWKAIRMGTPIAVDQPHSAAAMNIHFLVDSFLKIIDSLKND